MQCPGVWSSFPGQGPRENRAMRIGLVVDSACDLPGDYLRRHNVTLLPVTVHIGEDSLTDMRDEQATLQFLHSHLAERGADAETAPFTGQKIQELFLGRPVLDYDKVFCLTTTTKKGQEPRREKEGQ